VFRLRGEPARDFLKEDEREPQLTCEVIGDGDRCRHRLRKEPTIEPEGAQLHGKPTTLGIAAAPQHFGLVAVRERPGLRQIFGAGVFR
jgi:hypothetical protein